MRRARQYRFPKRAWKAHASPTVGSMHGSSLKSSVSQLLARQPCGLQNFQLGVTRQGVEGWVELVIYL